MFVMNLLRIFADLGFYFAFAATVSAAFGGRLHLPALVVLGLCYAVCFRLRGKRRRQYRVLGAAALALLLPVSWADRAAYFPALVYVVHLVRQDNFDLSRSRQAELFELFGRIFSIFTFLWCAVRFIAAPIDDIRLLFPVATREWLTAGVPMALLGAGASVLLMRSARHEPAVYLQPGFQAVNAAAAAFIVLAAAVSSPWAVGAMVWTYWNVLLPVLLVCFMAVGLVLVLTYPVIKLVVNFLSNSDTSEALQELLARLHEFFETFHQLFGLPPVEVIFRTGAVIITVLSLLLAAFLTRFVVGWLLERWRERTGSRIPIQTKRLLPVSEALQRRQGRRSWSNVERVRRQYQTFLRLCRKHGVDFSPASTSGDISGEAAKTFGADVPLEDIQDIYREARYHGTATRTDVSRMRKLCEQVKKHRPRGRA